MAEPGQVGRGRTGRGSGVRDRGGVGWGRAVRFRVGRGGGRGGARGSDAREKEGGERKGGHGYYTRLCLSG
jgi:hypothetical protein